MAGILCVVKRLWRIIFNGATVLSLLLLVTTLVLWIRSGTNHEGVYVNHETVRTDGTHLIHGGGIASRASVIYFHYSVARFTSSEYQALCISDSSIEGIKGFSNKASLEPFDIGFRLSSISWRWGRILWLDETLSQVGWSRSRFFTLPAWLLAVLFAAIPFFRIVQLIKRQRARLAVGLCSVCRYDLRATPDRCPECGNVPNEVKTST